MPLAEEDSRFLSVVRRMERLSGGASAVTCYVSGATYLLLSFYITYDVLARKFGWPYSGVTDDISSYGMAFAVSWAMGYVLMIGGHIRIDIILPMLPRSSRDAFDLAALITLAIFAGMIAYYCWNLAIQSHEIDARSVSTLQMPMMIPQGLLALGFTWFTIQTIITTLAALVWRVALGDTGLAAAPTALSDADLPRPLGET